MMYCWWKVKLLMEHLVSFDDCIGGSGIVVIWATSIRPCQNLQKFCYVEFITSSYVSLHTRRSAEPFLPGFTSAEYPWRFSSP